MKDSRKQAWSGLMEDDRCRWLTTAAHQSDLFISQTEAAYSETTLVDVRGDGQESGLSFAGFTLDVAQLR